MPQRAQRLLMIVLDTVKKLALACKSISPASRPRGKLTPAGEHYNLEPRTSNPRGMRSESDGRDARPPRTDSVVKAVMPLRKGRFCHFGQKGRSTSPKWGGGLTLVRTRRILLGSRGRHRRDRHDAFCSGPTSCMISTAVAHFVLRGAHTFEVLHSSTSDY